jgi:hypothetical protein
MSGLRGFALDARQDGSGLQVGLVRLTNAALAEDASFLDESEGKRGF